MSSQPHQKRHRWSISRKLKWIGVLIIGLPLAVFMVWRGSLALEIREYRERSILRGEPQTIAELTDRYREIPEDENAAAAIVALWQAQSDQDVREQLPPPDPNTPIVGRTANVALPWPPTELEAARRFVELHSDWFDSLRTALALPDSRFPIEVSNGFRFDTSTISRVKNEVVSLHVQNLLAIQEGRVDESLDTLDQMVRMTNVLKGEPFLITLLIHISCSRLTMNGMEQLISWHPLNHSQLNQLESLLARLRNPAAYHSAVIGERALSLSVFTTPISELAGGDSSPISGRNLISTLLWSLMKYSGYQSLDHRLMLQAYDEILVLGTNLTAGTYEEISNAVADTIASANRFPPKPFTRSLFPAFTNTARKSLRIATEQDLLRVALAIEHYRVNKKISPATLNQLIPSVTEDALIDPYDGRRYRYLTNNVGYVVYSVGIDGIDNQAQPIGDQEDFAIRISHHYPPNQ